MDGTVIPFAANDGERRSPSGPSRPAGLPVFSTEPLTAAERDLLRRAARIVRLIADRLDEALEVNQVAQALSAATKGAEAGQALVDLAAKIGRNR